MQHGRDTEGSQARQMKHTTQGKRRAYNNAMNSKTAGLLGIHSTRPGSSQFVAATESQWTGAASPVVPVDESDEEENSYDKNDTMSEEEGFGDGHIEISDDGNDGAASKRGKKRQKGMKVSPKVSVQPSGKSGSKVWDHFEKVPVPSTTQSGATVIMAQCNYCKKFLSYKTDQEGTGATTHLTRHYTKSCADYKTEMAKIALGEACEATNPDLKAMGQAMMGKFNKYWEEPNNVMVIATILDPRYKLKYIKWGFKRIYAHEKATAEYNLIDTEFAKLYETYDMYHRHEKADNYRSGASSSTTVDSSSLPSSASEFTSYLSETNLETSKNELDKYLDEANESLLNKNFDVLLWWKLNSHRYPVVAKMAKNFLTIPATSVSSESTFSTGGRVLDDYRSSLMPAMVEALVCASSWLKGAHNDNKVSLGPEPDDGDDVESIPFPKSVAGSN